VKEKARFVSEEEVRRQQTNVAVDTDKGKLRERNIIEDPTQVHIDL